MEELKRLISDTVFVPQHLRDWTQASTIKDTSYHIVFEILNVYYMGVTSDLLDNKKVKRLCRKIDRYNHELSELSPPHINLQNWLWIGDTIEKWIDFAVMNEEFEVAANLRKLLNSEYV